MLVGVTFKKLIAGFGLIMVLLAVFLIIKPHTSAQEVSWVSGDMPHIQIGAQEITSKYLMPGNRTCYEKSLVSFVYKKWNDSVPIETPIPQCTVTNQLGVFGSSGYISPNTGHVYKTNLQNLSHSIVGVPDQPMFLVTRSSQTQGVNLHIYRDIRSNGAFQDQRISNGYSGIVYKFHSLKPSLKDSANQALNVHEFAFSENGEWMVAEVVGIGLVRINMITEKMTLFSNETFNRGQGFPVDVYLSISDDGKYALKSGRNAKGTFVYDISTCQSTDVFSIYNRPTTGCEKKSLDAFLKNNAGPMNPSDILFLNSMRFAPDSRSIKGIVVTGPETTKKLARKITLSLNQITPDPLVSYVAMGDSFASGEGDMDDSQYEDGTNEKGINMCHLSKRSYPYLISSVLQIPKSYSVACSGARTQHLLNEAQYPKSKQNTTLLQMISGLKPQNDYLIQKEPSFITLSIGGNDLNFLSIIRECVGPGTCSYAQDQEARAKLAKRIAGQQKELKNLYSQIADETRRQTKIYVIGYPQFIDAHNDSCGVNVALDSQERWFIYKTIEYANKVIESSARAAGVRYIDSEDSLKNYNLCSGASDSQMAVNGITEGDDNKLPWYFYAAATGISVPAPGGYIYTYDDSLGVGNESFHPNQNGHELMKQNILAETEGSPADFPVCAEVSEKICPDSGIEIPSPDVGYFGVDVEDFVSCLNSLSCVEKTVEIQKDMIRENLLNPRSAGIFVDDLKSESEARIEIHSTPTVLGNFTVNGQGVLDTLITIPDSIPSGYHEIHVIGLGTAGEPVNYYQTVFLAGPTGDINSNNVPDGKESCGFVEPSGQDYDKDGVDDACDKNIGNPPDPPPQTESTNADIIGVVNNQNQNALGRQEPVAQSQGSNGLQGASSSNSRTANNGLQGTGTNLLANGNTGSLLDRTEVLGASSVAQANNTTYVPASSSGGFPVLLTVFLAVIVCGIAVFVRHKNKN